MIHQNVIKRRADEDGLPAPTVERDYVLAHVLTAISERDEEQRLVFKGGTSLRVCHFTDYRYSADLDFSLTGGVDAEGATRLIAEALVDCRERIGLPLLPGRHSRLPKGPLRLSRQSAWIARASCPV